MLVGVGDPFVIFFLKLVLVGVRIRISSAPELLYKPLPLIISLQLFKGLSLLISNDVGDVLVQPVLVGFFKLWFHIPWLVHWVLALFGALGKQKCGAARERCEKDRQAKNSFEVKHCETPNEADERCTVTCRANREVVDSTVRPEHSQDAENNRFVAFKTTRTVPKTEFTIPDPVTSTQS